MRENSLIIICITIIVCISLIAGTFIIINSNDNSNSDDSTNTANDESSSQNTAVSTSDPLTKINWVTFYADGNPNTGEQVTVNIGSQYAGKNVLLSMNYYRDGYTLIEEPDKSYTVNSEGSIYVPDTTSMARYPDKCILSVTCDGYTATSTCYLEKRKGSQTLYF